DAYQTLFTNRVVRRAKELEADHPPQKPGAERSDTRDGPKLAGGGVA
ncbi:MAG: hypothetical protein JWN40_2548, partial [Phycisphaerales bacterium]|nr:hypothetical protein [Phycisphaerales bacterium]